MIQNALLREMVAEETTIDEIQTSLQSQAEDFIVLLSGELNAASAAALTKSLSNLNVGLKRVNQILQKPS